MKKIGTTTIASIAVNVILSLWIVNQYFYDQFFHSYVDAALGPVYPFIVLTAGLGGGSSLGYLLLKRRHSTEGIARPERGRLFKSGGPVSSGGNLSSVQGKVLPRVPPLGQASRHTAYAVPSLARSSSPSAVSRGTSLSSTSAAARTSAPPSSAVQRLEQLTQPSTSALNSTLREQYRPEQLSRSTPSVPPPPTLSRGENTQPVNRVPPEPPRASFPQQWKPEPPPQMPDRGSDSTVFPRPTQTEGASGARPSGLGPPLGQVPRPPQPSQAPFPVSKWTPSEEKAETQWTDPVPKPGPPVPQKWGPPTNTGIPPPPQGGPPRPGPVPPPGPIGQRPPFPPGQGPPRPLGYPGPPRPGQPGPVGVPPPFRSDQPRPSGPPFQARQAQGPGPPLPQPWSPPPIVGKSEQPPSGQVRDSAGASAGTPAQLGTGDSLRPPAERNPEPSTSGGEMDWDTALDTILKTLKKDRGVGEKG